LVMEYLEGETLADRLERGPLPLDQALKIAIEVSDALDKAHRKGAVHRDIKPGNIMLVGGEAVVADFGIARAITSAGGEHLTETGIALGTPAYMSPEQAGGEETIDGRSDIYALGCVLYEMLGGEPPFTGPSSQAVIARQLGEEPRSLRVVRPKIPPAIEAVVRTALEKVPADRFQTAQEFEAALDRPPERLPGFWTAHRRRYVTAWSALALLLAAALMMRHLSEARPRGVATEGLDPMHVAVLYFDDQTDGHRLAHLATRITLDLIDFLGKVELLRVISSVGVQPFRSSQTPLDSIAETLRVGTIISGSVDTAGSELHVTVRLVDATTGQQLYSHTQDTPWGNTRALDAAIAEEVSFLLQRLGNEIRTREARRGTANDAAWRLFRSAMELWEDARLLLPGGRPEAEQLLWRVDSLLEEIQHMDPRWTTPIVQQGGLALVEASVAEGSGSPDREPGKEPARSKVDWLRNGLVHAERALSLAPGDPSALAVRGRLRYRLWEEVFSTEPDTLAAAEEDLRTAVTKEPQLAVAWYTLSELYRYSGRLHESYQAAREGHKSEVFLDVDEALGVVLNLFFASLNLERYDDASGWCRLGQERYLTHTNFADCDLRILGWSGRGTADIDQAWAALFRIEADAQIDKSDIMWQNRRALVAAVVARTGLADSAKAILDQATRGIKDPDLLSAVAYDQAYIWLLLGDSTQALRLLTIYLRANPASRSYVAGAPWFYSLHSDPRFEALVAEGPSDATRPSN